MKYKKIWFIILLICVFLLSTGFTYAYFSIKENVEGEPKDIEASTGTLRVSFTDGPEISLLDSFPGDSRTKTFIVNNNGTLDSYYKINWKEFNNEVLKDELSVSFICTSYSTYLGVGNAENVVSGKCDNLTEEAVYDRDLKTSIKISTGYTHEYIFTIKFLDVNVEQNYNQGKRFNGVLQVEKDSPSWVESCEDNNSLRCKVIIDNIPVGETKVTTDDTSSTFVTASTGVNFASISSPTNGHGLYRNTKIGDGNNYYFRGGNFCAYTDYLREDSTGTECIESGGTWTGNGSFKCSLDFDETECERLGYTHYRLNNNVSFAGYMWKIIRIDEEGNVKLLYNGTSTTARGSGTTIGDSRYNSKYKDNAYVGYMQPDNQPESSISFTISKEQAESNEINSHIKTVVDNWYRDNIDSQGTSVTSKIATSSGYCNDRRTITANGGYGNNNGTYASRNRVYTTHILTYKCSYESNDLFTVIGENKGNKKLIYPVGLITADEIAYGGSIWNNYNFRVYAHSGYNYWTLSPAYYSSSLANSAYLSSGGGFFHNYVDYSRGSRVSIALNSTAIVSSGNGSLETPYIIQ